ncbi:DUF92 domain-containing protein [Telmatobacter bradus]|uniref:DUF92 domain-containing protein n=1 Tax=Telmatobacter bradus TaxID=474953 RepID=UPI003B434EC3
MRNTIFWQSKLVLLAVLPAAAADLFLETHWWATQMPMVALEVLGTSLLLGLVSWRLGAATPGAAAAGVAITASLIYSTESWPYQPWRTALVPVLLVALLAHLATRLGRGRKQRLGLAEGKHGRTTSQIAANLGVAMLVAHPFLLNLLGGGTGFNRGQGTPMPLFAIALAAFAEAAADTVASEIGQVFGGTPRLLTTLRRVLPGTNGAISLPGTAAGALAAAVVAAAGAWAVQDGPSTFWIALGGGVFGFFFDSLLGATIEDRGWLNNDAVNFLSTASAALFAMLLLVVL